MVSQLKTNSGFHPNRFDLIFKVFIVQTFYFHFQILIVSSWRNDCWCILYLFLFFFKFIYYVPSVMPVTCHDGSMNFSKSKWTSHCKLWTFFEVMNIVLLHIWIKIMVLAKFQHWNEVELFPKALPVCFKWLLVAYNNFYFLSF